MIFLRVLTLRAGFFIKMKEDEKIKSQLINDCIKDYLHKKHQKDDNIVFITGQYDIRKGEFGKPYVESPDIEFSVSNTGRIWGCAVTDEPVGLDIQMMRPAKTEDIAKRFFTEGERKYIEKNSDTLDAFYDIWVRKEAYIKLTGLGLRRGLSRFAVADENGLFDSVDNEGKYKFIDISEYGLDSEETTSYGIKGAICIENGKELVVRCGLFDVLGEE